MTQKIDWTKPVEYKRGGEWVPAKFLGTRRNTDGASHILLVPLAHVYDCEGTVNVDPNSGKVRNVQEKKKFWTVTFKDGCGLSSETHAGPNYAKVVVGGTYRGGVVVSVVEGEYSA